MVFLTDYHLDVIRERKDLGSIRCALFDFDGTLSLIRQGWQDVMIPMMVEYLSDTPDAENLDTIHRVVTDVVARTTGKQTIYQMIAIKEEVEKRNGTALDPMEYKRDYLHRLDKKIATRIDGLESGGIDPESLRLPGAMVILQELKKRDVILYCASGTDEPYARHEADLLGFSDFFDGGVKGALDDYKSFSKRDVIKSIIEGHGFDGSQLLVVGDGFVEIEEGAKVGAVTVGVASDESTLLEKKTDIVWDEFKRDRLTVAGADMLVPDFRHADRLVAYLFNE